MTADGAHACAGWGEGGEGVDTLSRAERSERMSRVRSRDTKPELTVRRIVHGQGFRFRLHARNLPGQPDLVFPGRRKIIFVHGCFWHRHGACKNTRWPKTRLEFWQPKLEANHARDIEVRRALRKLGWKILTIWECQLKNLPKTAERINRFLADE
jgi:DNA mismatch endonuclease (patch repair protein)